MTQKETCFIFIDWHENRHTDQQSRTTKPERNIHPYIVSELMKKEPRISCGERTNFSKMALGKMDSPMNK